MDSKRIGAAFEEWVNGGPNRYASDAFVSVLQYAENCARKSLATINKMLGDK